MIVVSKGMARSSSALRAPDQASGEEDVGAVSAVNDSLHDADLIGQTVTVEAMLHKAASGMTAPFPAFPQRTALISARPRAEKRFMMAMRIWISAVWRSGSRDMILSPKSFR